MLSTEFFARDAVLVAYDLVGCSLLIAGVGGTIVETEAYTVEDRASHSFRGRTKSNSTMFGEPAHAYVYRSYGLHWCLNFVCLPGSAVLIRALHPEVGLAAMRSRRNVDSARLLCSGPGRLAHATGVSGHLDGAKLTMAPFELGLARCSKEIVTGVRIGISKDAHRPWRFGEKGSPYLSRPFADGVTAVRSGID